MHAPTAAELLNVWENGLRQGPIDRAFGLLEAVYPERSAETLAELNVGGRDARLLQVRLVLFGPRATSTARCPRCSERLEWESEVADLLIYQEGTSSLNLLQENADASPFHNTTPLPQSPAKGRRAILKVAVEGYQIKFRLPNSGDFSALSHERDAAVMRTRLLERCLLEASASEGESLRLEQLPETALQAMVREMERADPQSNLQVSLTCPACGHCWEALFDIVSFLWAEINNWAERTLRSVHLLARAYGWREADILAMSPTRRQMYLEMASQ